MAKDYEGKTLKVGDHLGWFNFGSGGNHGTITKIIDDNHVEVKDVDGHIYPISLTSERYVLSNSRACNSVRSRNAVVAKALNACGTARNAKNDDPFTMKAYNQTKRALALLEGARLMIGGAENDEDVREEASAIDQAIGQVKKAIRTME